MINPLQKTRAAACIHLGLATDPVKRLEQASDEHRCYVGAGQERVDLDHQRRFCLASSYMGCPFLAVSKVQPRRMEQIEAWWRNVSPRRPALTAAQLGQVARLGAAAAQGWLTSAAVLTLQTWRMALPVLETAMVSATAHVAARRPRPTTPPQVEAKRPRPERVEAKRAQPRTIRPKTPPSVVRRHYRRSRFIQRAIAEVIQLVRMALASVAVMLGAAWLLSAAPAQLREHVLSASHLSPTWLPDAAGVTSLVHVTLAGGYDVGLAVPYSIGFAALFVGLGSLGRRPSPGRRW
jgi:hypothetical protein